MKAKLTITTVLLFSFFLSIAQDFPYTLSVDQQDYERLDNPTILTQGVWDDPDFDVQIGFDFVVDTANYSSLVMTDDFTGGILFFGPSPAPDDILVAYASDVIDPGYNDNKSLGYIAYQIDGESGSQVFKMEWNNVGFYNEVAYTGTANNLVNFQVWLYEGSNDIEWHFGPNTVKDPSVHDVGGVIFGLGYDLDLYEGVPSVLYHLIGDVNMPEINAYSDFDTYPSVLDSEPPSGTVYRLSSLYVGTRDVPQLASTIQIQPTIVQDFLTIYVDQKNNEQLNLSILNLLGQVQIPYGRIQDSQQVDLSTLSAGIYFVQVRSEDAVWTQKIIKE